MAPLASLNALALLGLSLFQHVAATPAANPHPGVVSMNFEKRKADPEYVAQKLRKRAPSTAQATLYNDILLYIVNATVGSSSQAVQLQVDTGSSDTWVPAKSSTACQEGDCVLGSFDETASTSFNKMSDGFEIAYGDGTQIKGDYFTDTFSVAGVSVTQQVMGLALEADENTGQGTPVYGLIGVGFDTNEAIFGQSNGQQEYADVVHQMVTDGLISTRAFSLWLNDLGSASGNILFGGVDAAKYSGDLVVLPLQADPQSPLLNSYTVTFYGLEVDSSSGASQYSGTASVPVLLDSGNSVIYLPDEIVIPVNTGFGASLTAAGWIVPCSLANYGAQVKFRLGNANGPIVAVDVADLVEPFANSSATAPLPAGIAYPDGSPACRWGLQPASTFGSNSLGDTFLRSAYVVYNQDGNSLAIGQTKFNVSDTNIKQITASDTIPGATSTATGAPLTPSTSFTQSYTSSLPSSPVSPTFSLGTATTAAGPGSSGGSSHTGAAGHVAPSVPFLGTVVAAVCIMLGMLGGSVVVFM